MTGFLLLFARIPVLVLALVTTAGSLGSSALTVQAYSAAQEAAQSQLVSAQEQITSRIADSVMQQAALQLAIGNAKTLLNDSSGKTLDETSRAALSTAIAEAQAALDAATAQVLSANSQLLAGQSLRSGFSFPWQVNTAASALADIPVPAATDIARLVSALGERMTAVTEAQGKWVSDQEQKAKEAERIAAAARAAAARAAAARAAASAAGVSGATTPSAPSAPSPSQVTEAPAAGFNAVSYIAAIAPNAQVIWQADVCFTVLQRVVYLCGFTTTPSIAPGTNNVRIYLDSTFTERYGLQIGKAVLVHEAAHARQYAKYGAQMIAAQSTVPSWVFNIANDPHAPIEFMAECATIAKLGYGAGTYIGPGAGNYAQSCTAEQLAEGAELWR